MPNKKMPIGWFAVKPITSILSRKLQCDHCTISLQSSFIGNTVIAYSYSSRTSHGFWCSKCKASHDLKKQNIKQTQESINEYLNNILNQYNNAPILLT